MFRDFLDTLGSGWREVYTSRRALPSFPQIALSLYPACTCASMISLHSAISGVIAFVAGLQIEALYHDEKALTKNLSLTPRFYIASIFFRFR